jgi:hypothetical protein
VVTRPTMLVMPTTRRIPATMVGTAILAMATGIADLTTALIGVKVGALRAEFIGDITAGTKVRSLGLFASRISPC